MPVRLIPLECADQQGYAGDRGCGATDTAESRRMALRQRAEDDAHAMQQRCRSEKTDRIAQRIGSLG